VVGGVEQQVGAEQLGDVRLAGHREPICAGVKARSGSVREQLRRLGASVQPGERMLDRLLCSDRPLAEDRALARTG
jgi:hypothetical protein